MRQFNYNVLELIEGIKSRPCIWDKNSESYKDRVERKCAWEEIFNSLEPSFETMSGEQRRFVEEQIITKWTNIRDTFYKSLKTKMGRPKRKYVLYNELKFLIKGTPQEGVGEETINEEYATEDIPLSPKEEESLDSEPTPTIPKKKAKRSKDHANRSAISDVENNYSTMSNEFVTCDVANEARLMNEDEAFFASLLPTVVRYTIEERLDFRMEVLNVMKRIHSRRSE